MQEGVSLAAMTETPLVIVDAQRPAPATGLPTRTAQEDLHFVIHAGHGEFPKYVVAPRTARDAFEITQKAFYIADIPDTVIILLSHVDGFIRDNRETDVHEEYWKERLSMARRITKIHPHFKRRISKSHTRR